MESLSILSTLKLFIVVILITNLVISVYALIHVNRNPPRYIKNKWIWIAIIVLTLPIYINGAMLYGILNYRPLADRMFIGFIALLAIGYVVTPNISYNQVSARLDVTKAYASANTLSTLPHQQELLENLAMLDGELQNGAATKMQQSVYRQLGVYAQNAIATGFNDAQYTEWRSIFYYRNQIDDKYMKDMNHSRFGAAIRKTNTALGDTIRTATRFLLLLLLMGRVYLRKKQYQSRILDIMTTVVFVAILGMDVIGIF